MHQTSARKAPGRGARAVEPGLLFAVAILATAVLPPAARGEMSPQAREVVERHLEATGGRAAREQQQNLHLKGTIESSGLSGTWEQWIAQPDRWMRVFRLGPLHYREGFDGTVAWRTDLSHRSVMELDDATVEDAREEGWFLNERWALADEDGGTIRFGSRTFRPDRMLDAIEIVPPIGRPRRYFVNAETGFIEREITVSDQHTIRLNAGDYRMLAGRMRPGSYASPTFLPTDDPVERLTVDSAWVNVALDPTTFSPPVVRERSIIWTRAAGSMRAPFEYGSKAVFVQVSINGAPPAEFLLDTGATLTALDDDYAHAIGLEPEGAASVQGIAAHGEMKFARARSIALVGARRARATLRDFRVALLDFGKGSEMTMWRNPKGILGADFLSRFVVTLDYDSTLVTLHDPDTFEYRGIGAAVPFQLQNGIPIVELTVNDGCTGDFLVDVGNSFQFTIHGSMVRSCGLIGREHGRAIEAYGGGVGGGFVSTLSRLDSLSIGPFGWAEPIAALALHSGGSIGSGDYAGNIGNGVLERFRCTIDYRRHVLHLEPGRRFGEREHVSRFGALLARVGSRVYAGNVIVGSAAAEAGLRWFDEIVAIDDRPLERWTREEVDRVLVHGEPGSVHTVKYRRLDLPAKTVEVTLKDVL